MTAVGSRKQSYPALADTLYPDLEALAPLGSELSSDAIIRWWNTHGISTARKISNFVLINEKNTLRYSSVEEKWNESRELISSRPSLLHLSAETSASDVTHCGHNESCHSCISRLSSFRPQLPLFIFLSSYYFSLRSIRPLVNARLL